MTADDGAGEQSPEAEEVAASQESLGALIGHPPGSLSLAGDGDVGAAATRGQSHRARPTTARNYHSGEAHERGITAAYRWPRRVPAEAVVMVAAVLSWGSAGCL